MNQQQRKYSVSRVEEIFLLKSEELREKHTKEGKTLSGEEKVKALKSGKFKIKPDIKNLDSYSYITRVFDFTGEKKSVFNQALFDKEVKTLRKEKSKILDEIMLGDEENALRLIKEFSVK